MNCNLCTIWYYNVNRQYRSRRLLPLSSKIHTCIFIPFFLFYTCEIFNCLWCVVYFVEDFRVWLFELPYCMTNNTCIYPWICLLPSENNHFAVYIAWELDNREWLSSESSGLSIKPRCEIVSFYLNQRACLRVPTLQTY